MSLGIIASLFFGGAAGLIAYGVSHGAYLLVQKKQQDLLKLQQEKMIEFHTACQKLIGLWEKYLFYLKFEKALKLAIQKDSRIVVEHPDPVKRMEIQALVDDLHRLIDEIKGKPAEDFTELN